MGGVGDALGCDAGPQGGFTHGHVVAATALGNASDVAASYGAGWLATDNLGARWKLDGVAPHARLVLYDAQVTPSTLSCADPSRNALSVGTLYLDNTPGVGVAGGRVLPRGAHVQLLVGHDEQQHLRHQRDTHGPVPVRSPGRGALRLRRQRRQRTSTATSSLTR